MKYQHWIFDLDGTVIDTLKDLYGAVNDTLKTFHLPTITLSETKAFIGGGARQFIRSALKDHGKDEAFFESFFAEYMIRYEAFQKLGSQPYPGMLALLTQLKQEGIRTYIFSNKPHELAVQVIDKVFPGLFVGVMGHKPKALPKPDPTQFFIFAQDHQIDLTKSVMIGDGIPDIQFGQQVNIPTIAVGYGYTDPSILLSYQPTVYVEKVAAIYPTVLKLA
jgi:phosphoglycolate phosphatase